MGFSTETRYGSGSAGLVASLLEKELMAGHVMRFVSKSTTLGANKYSLITFTTPTTTTGVVSLSLNSITKAANDLTASLQENGIYDPTGSTNVSSAILNRNFGYYGANVSEGREVDGTLLTSGWELFYTPTAAIVANLAALNAVVNPADGETRFVTSEKVIYQYITAIASWQLYRFTGPVGTPLANLAAIEAEVSDIDFTKRIAIDTGLMYSSNQGTSIGMSLIPSAATTIYSTDKFILKPEQVYSLKFSSVAGTSFTTVFDLIYTL